MTKLRYRFFFILTILNTHVLLISRAKIRPKLSCGSGEGVDFVVLLFLVAAAISAISAIRPNPIFPNYAKIFLGKKFILLFLLFYVTAALLDIRPDPILQS